MKTPGLRALAVCAAFLLSPGTASAENDGVATSDMTGSIPNCAQGVCHVIPGSPDPNLTVTIAGPSTLTVNDIETYTISIIGAGLGPPILGAGLHVAAYLDDILQDIDDDVLFSTQANTRITDSPEASGQLTHTDAQQDSIGVFSYDFDILAPATPGELRLEGTMNAANMDNTVLGEKWQTTTKIITVPEPAPWLARALGALLLFGLARGRR